MKKLLVLLLVFGIVYAAKRSGELLEREDSRGKRLRGNTLDIAISVGDLKAVKDLASTTMIPTQQSVDQLVVTRSFDMMGYIRTKYGKKPSLQAVYEVMASGDGDYAANLLKFGVEPNQEFVDMAMVNNVGIVVQTAIEQYQLCPSKWTLSQAMSRGYAPLIEYCLESCPALRLSCSGCMI